MIPKFADDGEELPITVKPKVKRPESLKRAQAKYYLKNKSKLTAEQLSYNKRYVRQTYKCECGDILKKSGKYLHDRCERHKRRMAQIANGEDPNHDPSREKIICECGSSVLSKNMKQHIKSKKHQSYIDASE